MGKTEVNEQEEGVKETSYESDLDYRGETFDDEFQEKSIEKNF